MTHIHTRTHTHTLSNSFSYIFWNQIKLIRNGWVIVRHPHDPCMNMCHMNLFAVDAIHPYTVRVHTQTHSLETAEKYEKEKKCETLVCVCRITYVSVNFTRRRHHFSWLWKLQKIELYFPFIRRYAIFGSAWLAIRYRIYIFSYSCQK